jgi:DNA-directed RNA polymerase specialized sigma24 family protein
VLANHQRGATRRGRLAARLQEELAYQVRFTQPTSDGSTARVHEVLLRLDDEDRELLTLTAWEGLSPSELAVIWSMPAPTVRTRLHRARQRFRAEYEALGRDGDERNGRTGHVAGEVQMLV